MIAYYRIADAFVCMSEEEGFGMALVEAMFYHVPVVAYESGAVPETLGRERRIAADLQAGRNRRGAG